MATVTIIHKTFMLKWINVLHIYQPPTQTKDIIDTVVHQSYSRIISLLETYPKLKLTLNIPGSLLELLDRNGHKKIIDDIGRFAKDGRIELLGTAMYHPILPLIPPQEVVRQIELHTNTSKKYFSDVYNPRGFYLPEMAYSNEVGLIIKKAGFDWVLLDEIHANGEKIDTLTKNISEETGLIAVFRNRAMSQTFPPEQIFIVWDNIKNNTLITVHDGEMYGHRHEDDHGFYKKAFENPEIQMQTVSEYLSTLTNTQKISLINASWESTTEELLQNIPFAVWDSPDNKIHKQLWHLANTVLQLVPKHSKDPHFKEAQTNLDKGIASCYWWWASERKLGVFSPTSWNPSEIEKGATFLLDASRALSKLPKEKHEEIEKIFSELRDAVWKRHWEIMGSDNTQHLN